MKRTRGRAKVSILTAAGLAAALVAGCTPNTGQGVAPANVPDAYDITVWITDTLPDRVERMQAIAGEFTAETGLKAELIRVPEHEFNQTLTSSAAAGNLPDVIGAISLGNVRTLAASKYVNPEANAAVIKNLGEETWSRRSLELTRDRGRQLAVPAASWQQVLYYRKDLFAQAGLAAPTTYGHILAAAKKLHTPHLAGFVAANKAGQPFTQQSFEHIAQGNRCELVNAQGIITFDSPQCVGALGFYSNLLTNYSVPGIQDISSVRSDYFAGRAAMAIWPTFMLDDLAGLRSDARPSCLECKLDSGFLVRNTGVVAGIQGHGGAPPAHFGEISSWTVTNDSDVEQARKFVEYLLSDGYSKWLSAAPDERIPVRSGTAAQPSEYADTWRAMPVGVGKREPLGRFYSAEVLSILLEGVNDLSHWGILQGRGDLAGAAMTELPIAEAVGEVTAGTADPSTAASKAASTLRSILRSLN
ncbi:extracellular solute-binding protein [Arthrobacter sp.]|uniref:ABC transporter substrate-binding protein n=1 Tax=Arthrobacter sp. TaxID=1667 RepID=UPI002811366A|nr:extracellular solute-binding protein [Arthrobacter sp.]